MIKANIKKKVSVTIIDKKVYLINIIDNKIKIIKELSNLTTFVTGYDMVVIISTRITVYLTNGNLRGKVILTLKGDVLTTIHPVTEIPSITGTYVSNVDNIITISNGTIFKYGTGLRNNFLRKIHKGYPDVRESI